MPYFRVVARLFCVGLIAAMTLAAPSATLAQGAASARTAYQRLLVQERSLTTGKTPSVSRLRTLVARYEHFAGQYARTGYADNALWQAARLAAMVGARTGREADRRTAKRLLEQLIRGYPSSSLLADARQALEDLVRPKETRNARATRPTPSPPRATRPAPTAPGTASTISDISPMREDAKPVSRDPEPVPPPATSAGNAVAGAGKPAAAVALAPADEGAGLPAGIPPPATLLEVRRAVLPELVRITLEMSSEVPYRDERLSGPPRVFFDLRGTVPAAALSESVLTYPGDVVRQIRVGTRPDQSTRVVLDLEGADRYSVFTLYNPYRLVVDVFRKEGVLAGVQPIADDPVVAKAASAPGAGPDAVPAVPTTASTALPSAPAPRAPEAPALTTNGAFSLARQLGLGVSRIVIDPGHGGHDPGALGKRVTEAEVVLDVALRLEKLLRKNPGFDVVLTRRTDVFVPLEERTAMANRANADLFLSIHANASRNPQARGIETYILNFASNPEAEAVAARENAASGRSMHQLPDIVRAIALNNKLDESREFASIVQGSLTRRLRAGDAALRDLGVKQAPFVVLIGASMPSVLAEISFITNARDVQLLRNGAHRQKIAESLHEAILKYQRALKATQTVAAQ